MTFKNRIVEHGIQSADQFLAHPKNPKFHPAFQRTVIHDLLSELGWIDDVIVSQRSGFVLDGHERIWTALEQGDTEPVPYHVVDVTEAEESLILATFDPSGYLAQQDRDNLDTLLREVNSDSAAIQQMLADLATDAGLYPDEPVPDPGAQIDRAQELQQKWQVKPGDLFEVGQHRILCGDSTKAEDVARVLQDDTPLLMVTDPPYGVEYDAHWRDEAAAKGLLQFGASRTGVVTNDNRIDWQTAIDLFVGDIVYCWHAGLHASKVAAFLEASGFEIRYQIIWAKPHFVIGRGHYNTRHEPCWYAVRKGKTASWIGGTNQDTLWNISLDKNVDGGHSTQKPLECMARPIRNHDAHIVYDPFLGSGTTLVACEQLGRRGRGIEIHPPYVAVTLERLSQMGLEVKRIE